MRDRNRFTDRIFWLQAADEEDAPVRDEPERGERLMERMLDTRTLLLTGEINKWLAERIVRGLLILEAENSEKPIRLFIDSPGGDIHAGFAIFDTIRFITPPVTAVGMGLVASAGALVHLAAAAERRFGLPNSKYLIHQPLSGMRGTATDIEIHAREIEKMRAHLNRVIASETGKSLKQVEKDTDRDFWMDAGEALEYGIISKVVTTRGELPE